LEKIENVGEKYIRIIARASHISRFGCYH
jgi:hypothetical protein